jgi:H+/Cl- antiporter ClcA
MRHRVPTTLARRRGRIYWATLAFLIGFAILIYVISDWYLLPALDAAQGANASEKRTLAAHARLLLAVVLVILVCGIMLTFRFGRFFFPRHREPQGPTKYVDAWQESGKRMQTPPPADTD